MLKHNEEIKEFVRQGRHPQLNSVLLYDNGELTAQCYFNEFTADRRNVIKSIMKSILSVGIGIACDRGLLGSLDDSIAKYLPEFSEGRDLLHRAIRIRHLLTMSSGILWNGGVHYHCPMMEQLRVSNNWVDFIADCAVTARPGTKHNYSEWDVMLLAAILSKVSGDAFDFLNHEIYKPLHIKSGRWFQSPDGVYYSVGKDDETESVSNLTALELLNIGKLFLQNGSFEGKQVVSPEYIARATAPSACDKGYGYLWWVGENWYGCRGFGGQSVTVLPEKERIIVTQATPTSRPIPYNDVIWYAAGLN